MTDIAQLSIRVSTLEMESAQRKMEGLGKTGQWLEGVISKAMAAFSAYKIAEWIRDSATLAARYETLGVVMGVVGNNAGYTRSEMERYAKALQDSGISMVESRNTLATMAQAHIDLARSTELARLAQDAAVIGNINSSEAFQRMIYGIQSGQTDILRTIGLNVNFEASYAKLAHTLGTTSQSLTEAQKTMARTNAVMEKAPDLAGAYAASMGTAGKQLLSMQRYAEDLQVVFGSLFGGAMEVGVQTLNESLRDMKKYLEENKVESALVRDNLQGAASNFVSMVKDGLSLRSTTNGIIEDLTPMEILSGGIGLSFALWRDSLGVSLGYIETMLGLVTYLPAKIAEGVAYLTTGVPDWLKNLADLPGKAVSGGVDRLKRGYKSTYDFYTGGAASTSASLLSMSGGENSGRSVDVGRILERERIRSGNAARAISEEDAKARAAEEAAKRSAAAREKERKETTRFLQEQYDLNFEAQQTNRELAAAGYEAQQQDAQKAFEWSKQWWAERNEWELQQAKDHADALKRVNTDLFGDLQGTLENWSKRSTDAIVEFCFTGKSTFGELITSMLKDMARLAIEKNVMNAVFGVGDGSTGTTGLAGWLGSLFGGQRAGGGPVSGGTPYLVGERGPELFVPNSSGSIVPNGAMGSTSIVVNVAANGQTDVKTAGENGVNLGRAIQSAVQAEIMKQQRSGGLLAGA